MRIDLVTWIEKVEADVDDMQIEFLDPADEEAQGLSPAEIEEENDSRLFNVMEYERQSRIELAKELEVLWQLRGDTASRVYVDGECVGFRLELDFEQLHCLPELNVKLPDVALLSVADFTLTQGESLSGFLECLPNLQTLNLEGTDLRIQGLDGQWTGSLPAAIGKLSRLTTLNLKNTLLTLTEQTAGQLGELTRLQVLDLSNNPLGVPPLVLKLTQLQHLNLRSTGITRCPIGILDHPYLQSLDLRNNGIARVPEAVRIQSVGENNVLLSGNPLTDEDSLRWVSRHRQQTGINVWIGSPMDNAAQPGAWLEGVPAQQAALRAGRWQRVLNLTGSGRFFGALEIIGRTADFRVDYTALQQRVWHMVDELEASPGLCRYLFEEVQWPAIDGDDPFAGFVGLEGAIAEHGSAAAGQRLP
ncbi:NEL-type E3 ubiquitin ligase domain-containing protein [Pseudomonas sp. 10S4]|uniref:NEL-type E3 ubiquitin ligase domain-containing protein n=1 Tax=Pseudomonas sp. 10S4 TaxID=3048583 RepID=UPI002AC8E7E8|nr:NEL-type E3 ubiquitin ligase domain-containing protein [Pseudomonas sp. 10S4]WPX16906.1 NEL-type E3 ubiquitin ligase domain-containing protein [Pseudomonas sp. 10S4]